MHARLASFALALAITGSACGDADGAALHDAPPGPTTIAPGEVEPNITAPSDADPASAPSTPSALDRPERRTSEPPGPTLGAPVPRDDARTLRTTLPTPPAPAPLGAPYPIVLAHGMMGTDQFVDLVDYWYRIPEHLADHGELVYVAEVDPLADSTTRGAQLAAFVQTVLAHTQREKVIIIGHSQGGLDARVVAHDHPAHIAAVVTLATPHRGSAAADAALGLVDNPFGRATLDGLARLFGPLVYDMDGNFDVAASLRQFSRDGIADFNAQYPDAPGVRYLSLAGRTDMVRGDDPACATPHEPSFVLRWSGEQDPAAPTIAVLEDLLDGTPFLTRPNRTPNDGLVTVESARWGEFLGCIPADHLEEVGQLFGAHPGCSLIPARCNRFDYLAFFADLADWLRSEGL